MLRLRILEAAASGLIVWLDRKVTRAALDASLEEIKWRLRDTREHFIVVADNGELYSIVWRT